MKDELNAPLGSGPRRPRKDSGERYQPFALLLLGIGAAAAATLFLRAPDSGESQPSVIAKIEPAIAPPPPPAPLQPSTEAQESAGDATRDIEMATGVKVTRRGESGTARIIHIDPPGSAHLAPAPDKRVTEKGRYGLLPRIGPGGERPMDVYARPLVPRPALKPDAPRLALVIGGLGLDARTTQDAINVLPEDVTLAFAPYGAELDRLAAQARARGHETLLQAPMEPFDYPANNPGPHTLLVGAADGGVDDLHWLMSRFAGYAGVMNHLGGRFTADEAATHGALSEIAGRGLFYLDDGLSPQSQVETVAKKLAAPYAKVDLTVDQDKPAALEAGLAQLEAIARDRGVAIGFANATPESVARLARFTHDLERRGVALLPVSAALASRGAPAAKRQSP